MLKKRGLPVPSRGEGVHGYKPPHSAAARGACDGARELRIIAMTNKLNRNSAGQNEGPVNKSS